MISIIIRNGKRKDKEGIVKPYLEFKSSTPMTITPNYTNTGITLQYSLNKVTWTNIASKGITPSANTIYFRGRATGTKSLYSGVSTANFWIFTNATNLEVNGDITMLIQDTLGGMVRDIPLGNSAFTNMFYGRTILTKGPSLPSTTLATNCYNAMFNGCTNLTTLPALPATTLAYGCYYYMFWYCAKIKLSTTKTGNYQTAYRIPTVGTGVNAAYALECTFLSTGGTFTGNPTINTTYYTENQVI